LSAIPDSQSISEYEKWLPNAIPYKQISYKIDNLVTNRLEKYRAETEDWLGKHNYRYNNLLMCQHKTARDRQLANRYGEDKAGVYNLTSSKLFIESSIGEAQTIHRLTSRPVYCVDNNTMYSR